MESPAVHALEQEKIPPTSAMATLIATPASSAMPIAVAAIFFAPASVKRLVLATYMGRV
jgi:hypothetical protein